MFGRIEVGLSHQRIMSEVSKALQQIPNQSIERAMQAASEEIDPNNKSVIAAQALLNELLPIAIATATTANNEKLARGLDELCEQIRDALRNCR